MCSMDAEKDSANALPASSKNPAWMKYVSALLGVAILVTLFSSCQGGQKHEYDMDNPREAAAQCEARIERLLKSPATADFNSDATGGGTWTVTGTVDAQNSFGATVRANYQCTVVMNPDEGTARTTVDSFDG